MMLGFLPSGGIPENEAGRGGGGLLDSSTQKRLMDEIATIIRTKRTTISDDVMIMSTAAYKDPERQKKERELLFRRHPIVVALSMKLKEPGDFITEDVAGMPIIVVRGQDGVVRTFLNACRHRGNKLTEQASGNKKLFVCGYHAWSFDNKGVCRSVCDEAAFKEVDKSMFGLRGFPTEERHGMVWAILTPGESIDIESYLGETLDAEIGGHGLESQFVFAEDVLRRDFNWKFGVDTFQEVFHVDILHKETLKGLFSGLATLEGLGRHHRFTAIRASYPTDPAEQEKVDSILPHTSIVYSIFPNTVLIWQMDHIEVWQMFPHADRDDSCVMRIALIIPKAPDERSTRYWNRNWEILQQSVWKEDYDTMTNVQRVINSGELKEFVFGKNEAALQYYHSQVNAALAYGSRVS